MTYVGDPLHRPWQVRAAPYAVPRPRLTERLTAALAEAGPRTIGLVGPPGSGRSTLVRALCLRPDVLARYPHGVAWVALGVPPAAPEHLPWDESPAAADLTVQAVRALQGSGTDTADPRRATAALLAMARAGVLLVVDDVRDAEQAALLRSAEWSARPGPLLITADAALLPPDATVVRMEPMERAESVALLRQVAAGLDDEAADRLAARAADRPLQLVLAGRIFGLAYRSLVDRAAAEAAVPSGGPDPVASAVAALRERLSPDVRDRLAALAACAPDRDIPLVTVAAVWETDPGEAYLAGRELAEAGLLDDFHAATGVLRLHESVRRCLTADPPSVAETVPPPVDAVTDPRWMCRRLAQGGLSALAADVAAARAAVGPGEAQDILTGVARVLREEGNVFAEARAERVAGPLLVSRLSGTAALRPALDRYTATLPVPCLVAAGPPSDSDAPAVLRRAVIGHVEPAGVHALAVPRDGSWMAAASGEWSSVGKVTVWEPHTGRRLRRIRTELTDTVVAAPDGSWLATASTTGIHLCDVTTGVVRHELPGRNPVIAPDGRWLAAVDDGGLIRIFDAATGAQRRVVAAHQAPVTALLVAPDGTWLASAGEDGAVRVWEARTGRRRRVFPIARVTALAVAPDGAWLAAAGPEGVHLLDPATGTRRELATGGPDVHDLAVAPDGSWLAAACARRPVRLWSTGDGRLRHEFAVGPQGAHVLAVAPDGSWLAASGAADRSLRLWDPRTGATRRWLRGAGPARSLAVAPDGSWLAVGDEASVTFWDPHVPAAPGAEPEHALAVDDLAVSLVGPVTAGPDAVRTWKVDGTRHRRLPVPHPATSVAVGPTWLAAGTAGGTVHVWDAANGRPRHTIDAHPGRVRRLVTPADGSWLATTADPPGVHVWDPATGRRLLTVPDGSTPMIAAPDGSWLAATTRGGRGIEVWDVAAGTRRHALTSETGIAALTVSADGHRLGAARGPLSPFVEHVWDVRTGAPATADDAPAPGRHSPGWSIDGRSLLRVSHGLTAPLRERIDREHVAAQRSIEILTASPEGRWLAVLSGRRPHDALSAEIRVYDVRAARAVARMPLREPPDGCAWSADGSALYVWGGWGLTVFAWVTAR